MVRRRVAKRPVKSGYYDDEINHPEGGGTCDICGGEVQPGDGYESDFESSREIADDAIYERLTGKKYRPFTYGYEFEDWLGLSDDELWDAECDIVNDAFKSNNADYICPDCAHEKIREAAFRWVEDNYEVEPLQSSVETRKKAATGIKKSKSSIVQRCMKTDIKKRKSVKSSVDWGDFETPEADAINKKYLPDEGEGDTKATQAVTAVNKLIYQWYNNGEVYDNRGGFGYMVNGCDTYANWLANHIDGVGDILERGAETSFEGNYEDALKEVFDFIFDEALLEQLNMEPKEDTIYRNSDDFDNEFYEHEVCGNCGEDVTDDSSAINPENGDGELEQLTWNVLGRNSDFSDVMEYSYGFYEPDDDHNDLYDLFDEWYHNWYRNHSDNTVLCKYCAEDAAEDAASYIEDNYDWYDEDGYDKRTGFNDEGYDREGYDENGFNEQGNDREGYNREGYNSKGRNREGYDKEGYDENGLDARGLGKDRKMGSDKALKHFLGVDTDEDLTHDSDYYRKRK